MSYRKEYEKAFRKKPEKVRRLDALKLKLIQKMDTHGILMTEYDPREIIENIIIEAKKEVFDDIEKSNIWTTGDIEGSSETKFNDEWLSINIINKLKKRHLSTSEKKHLGKIQK